MPEKSLELPRKMVDVKSETSVDMPEQSSSNSCCSFLCGCIIGGLLFSFIFVVIGLPIILSSIHDGKTCGNYSVVACGCALNKSQVIHDSALAFPLDSRLEEEEDDDVFDSNNVFSVDRMFDDRGGSGDGGDVPSDSMTPHKRASLDELSFEIWNKNRQKFDGSQRVNRSTNLDNQKSNNWTISTYISTRSRPKKKEQVNEIDYHSEGIFDVDDSLPLKSTNDKVVEPNIVAQPSTLDELVIPNRENADKLKIDDGEWVNSTESVGNDDEITTKDPNDSNSELSRTTKSVSAVAPRGVNWRDYENLYRTIPCDTTQPCNVTETCPTTPEAPSTCPTTTPCPGEESTTCVTITETCTTTAETCTTTTECKKSPSFTICTKPTTTCSCAVKKDPCASTTRKCMKKVCLITTECPTTQTTTKYDCNAEEGWTIPAKYKVTFPPTTECGATDTPKPTRRPLTNFPPWWSCRTKCTKSTTCQYEPLTTCTCLPRLSLVH